MIVLLLLLISLISSVAAKSCYNHQTEDYTGQFQVTSCGFDQLCSVAPFFSPDNALEAHLQMIKEAKNNIVIANPNFVSWNYKCSHLHTKCNVPDNCKGCDIMYYNHEEKFPLYSALLNAIHLRNITVKILTNNYSVPTCPDKVTQLDSLHMNGALVRFYKTTQFLHAKFLMIDDGEKVLVSSINFSEMSFMKNRECGVIISNCANCEVIKLYKSAYEYDWQNADRLILDNQYSENQIETITNPARLENIVITPPEQRIPNIKIKKLKVFDNIQLLGYVGPDYARSTLISQLKNASKSILVHIYSITDRSICELLIYLKTKGINVTLLVSKRVFNKNEWNYDKLCYDLLIENGITVQSTYNGFVYSHQKYWIIDSETVYLCTGNWDGTDFPYGNHWKPNDTVTVNRNMVVAMSNRDLVQFYVDAFEYDFTLGTPYTG